MGGSSSSSGSASVSRGSPVIDEPSTPVMDKKIEIMQTGLELEFVKNVQEAEVEYKKLESSVYSEDEYKNIFSNLKKLKETREKMMEKTDADMLSLYFSDTQYSNFLTE